ncbi:thiol-disulfide oxidoreductase [compost metagenome]
MINLNLLSQTLLWLFFIFLLLMLLLILKLQVEFLNRFRITRSKSAEGEGLQIGQKAPLFRERDLMNNLIKLDHFLGKKILLIFVSSTCSLCGEIVNNLDKLLEIKNRKVIVITNNNLINTKIPDEIVCIYSKELSEVYMISYVPSIVMINDTGNIDLIERVTDIKQIVHMATEN